MLFVVLLVVVVVVVVLLLLNTTVYPLIGVKLTVLVFDEVEDEPPLVVAVLVVVEVVV